MSALVKQNQGGLAPFRNQFVTEFDNLVDAMFDSFWTTPAFVERNWKPTDIKEDKDNVLVEIELPRLKKEEVVVTTKNGELKVQAKTDKVSYVRTFRFDNVDVEKTTTKLVDGVLYLTIPKNEEAKERVIEIT